MVPAVRAARIVEAIGRYWSVGLSCLVAAEVLRMSEGNFRRLPNGYEARRAEGLIEPRRGRASARAVPVDRIDWVPEPYRSRHGTGVRSCIATSSWRWGQLLLCHIGRLSI